MAHVRIGRAALRDVKPSEAELTDARRIIAESTDPAKKEKACMASMTHWLKSKAAGENDEALQSRGEKRREYLENFMVLQSREKRAKTSQVTQRSSGSDKKKENMKGWFSYEFLCSRVGKKRVDAHIEAKLVSCRADEKLGELGSQKEMMDYFWDFETETTSTYEHNTSTIEVSNDADAKKGLAMLESMGDEVPAATPVKREPQNEADLKNNKIEELKADPAPTLHKYQAMSTDVKVMKSLAQKERYQDAFVGSVDKFIPKLLKAIKMVEMITMGGSWSSAKTGELIELLDKLSKEYDSLMAHANKFGFGGKTSKRTSRKVKG